MTASDARWMQEALRQALTASREDVRPNPTVGAVVVSAGRVVGRGAHRKYGGPHAEVHAIHNAGRRSVGATLYVTLEPCAHHGKTPACTDLILRSGIRRVVYGARDPHRLVDGKGDARLRKAGLRVSGGVLEAECRALNQDWEHWLRTGRPYTIAKIARSLDGHSRTGAGRSRWITGAPARQWAHRLRAACDAILVGSGTVLADDPLLNVRYARVKKQPLKVVLDSRLRTSPRARIFSKASSGPVLLAAARGVSAAKKRRYAGKAEVLEVPVGRDGRLDLGKLFSELGRRGVVSLLVEGGEETLTGVLRRGLARELYVFVAPVVLGGGEGLPGSPLEEVHVSAIGRDLVLYGRL